MSLPVVLCPWLDEPFERLARAAAGGKLGHGWLVTGARGIGKRNLAYLLADRMLSGKLGSPAPAAAGARAIAAAYADLAADLDLHPDLHRVRAEEGKASIAVDQIRATTADLALTPHLAGLKLVIIERAESMTIEAANALLKSLEEPTPNTWLFLLAERPGRLPATIRSRCQHLRIRPPTAEGVTEWFERDGVVTAGLPAERLATAPIAWAERLIDEEKTKEISKLIEDLKAITQDRADTHELARRWQKGDLDLALECLSVSLRGRIREQLIPGLSNPFTDRAPAMTENGRRPVPIDALFAGLKMAENLRDQLGRGINEELALTALLLGLQQPDDRRVNT